MADQQRDYEDYRRGGRRDWNADDERRGWSPERFSGSPRERNWRSQGDGDRYSDDAYSFGRPQSGYGRGTDFGGRGSAFDERGSFEASGYGSHERDRESGGDRGYGRARDFDLGSYRRESGGGWDRGRSWQEQEPWQSGASRHETDWESGNAGRGMRNVYSSPSHGRSSDESTFDRGFGGWRSGLNEGRRSQSSFGETYGSTFGHHGGASGRPQSRSGFAGRGPKDYQRSDERIREEISDRMTEDDSLDASDVTVQVRNGEVTLTGTVHSRDEKRRAEDLADSISGVREVTNNVRIAREGNGVDLTQSGSVQVGQSSQSGQGTKHKSGTSTTGAS